MGDVSLLLKKTDPKKNKYTLEVLADDKLTTKSDKSVNEPVQFYTGKDPVEELKPIAQHVTGFCAKDCAQPKSEVMIQFGTGKVDFAAVFKTLKSAG